MARQYPNLIDDLAIIQGEDYLELVNNAVIQLPGDLTNGTPSGQIRTDFLENGGILLANFSFQASVYDAVNDVTTLKPYLVNSQTSALNITAFKTGKMPSIRNCYVFDFEVDLNGIKYKLAAAFLQVKGEVTGNGSPPATSIETFLVASNNLSEITDPAEARQNLGIVSGIKPDWNADPASPEGITNRPDLSIYAQTTAVNQALNEKENADPTILRSAAIGVTVQPFSPHTLIDSEYTTVKQKAESALQPAALTPYALLNSPTFIGNVSLPNNTRINGVEHFYQATRPTVRGDGSALVARDRWWNTATGEEWFWSGVYWVSSTRYVWQGFEGNYAGGRTFSNTTNSQVNTIYPPVPVRQGQSAILFESIGFFYRAASANFDGQILVYAGANLALTIQGSDFSLARDRHRALIYPVNWVETFTADPAVTDGQSINFYLLVENATSPPTFSRGSTQAYFREVLV